MNTNKFSGSVKSYFINPPWISEVTKCESVVTFGIYEKGDDGTFGEINMCWYILDGKLTPKLECWHDAFEALFYLRDILSDLTQYDDKFMTVEQFCALLEKNGYKNIT